MDIGDWLDPSSIAYRSSADSKRQALSVVAEIAARTFSHDQQAFTASEVFDALLHREMLGSTGVGRGVAVPHARLAGLDRMRAVFVRLEQPVAFDSVDDQPVDLVFALFAPVDTRDSGSQHLRALARVSRLLRQGDLRERLRQARSADALHALLRREEEANAA